MSKPKRGWTLLLLSESGSEIRQRRISLRAVIWGAGLIALVVLLAFVETIALFITSRRAAQVDSLTERIHELETSEEEVLRLSKELSELKVLEQQIRRALMASELDTTAPSPRRQFDASERLSMRDESEATLPHHGGLHHDPASFTMGEQDYTSADLPTHPPVRGYVTRPYAPLTAFQSVAHSGMDIAAKEGTPVLAAADGIVTFAGWTYPSGYLIVIQHRTGYATYYGHNQIMFVTKGDFVAQAEPIALLGNSGRSNTPHVHFEVWQNGAPVDPVSLLSNF